MSAPGSRVYTTQIENVSVSAAQDIFSMISSASNGIRIHWIQLGSNATAATPLRMRLKRGTATVTLGSGGTIPALAPVDAGDTKAVQSTVHANDTTPATTTGAFTGIASFLWDTVLPFDFLPAPEDRPSCLTNQALILDMPASATLTLSGFIMWDETP